MRYSSPWISTSKPRVGREQHRVAGLDGAHGRPDRDDLGPHEPPGDVGGGRDEDAGPRLALARLLRRHDQQAGRRSCGSSACSSPPSDIAPQASGEVRYRLRAGPAASFCLTNVLRGRRSEEAPQCPAAGIDAPVPLAARCVAAFGAARSRRAVAAAAAVGRPRPPTDGAIDVNAYDPYSFDVKTIKASPGPLTVTLHEKGGQEHTFTIDGPEVRAQGRRPSQPEATGTVTLEAGTYKFECSFAGHAAAGMKGKIVVG